MPVPSPLSASNIAREEIGPCTAYGMSDHAASTHRSPAFFPGGSVCPIQHIASHMPYQDEALLPRVRGGDWRAILVLFSAGLWAGLSVVTTLLHNGTVWEAYGPASRRVQRLLQGFDGLAHSGLFSHRSRGKIWRLRHSSCCTSMISRSPEGNIGPLLH
ncbi:hypothetical protein B0H21DRAFT_190248 [Amylocystis lapponica]|nr:hypothetical protein B0H21DRAFT_190248 [Amylocystis lapponica]